MRSKRSGVTGVKPSFVDLVDGREEVTIVTEETVLSLEYVRLGGPATRAIAVRFGITHRFHRIFLNGLSLMIDRQSGRNCLNRPTGRGWNWGSIRAVETTPTEGKPFGPTGEAICPRLGFSVDMHRRRLLGATLAGLASGCLSGENRLPVTTTPRTDRPPVDSSPDWPMFRNDLANTGFNRNGEPPGANPTLEWQYETAATCDEQCQEAGSDAIWGSPALVEETVYIGSYDGHLYAVDASSGTEQWRFDADGIVDSSPAVDGETVYVGSWDGNVYAIDRETGTQQWASRTSGIVRSSPKVLDGTVYVGSRCGFLECADYETGVQTGVGELLAIDAETGAQSWRYSTAGNVVSTPAIGAGTTYVTGRDGTLHAVALETGVEEWTRSFEGRILSSPAVVGEALYVSAGQSLYCLDASSGETLWESDEATGLITSSPAVTAETVFIGTGFEGTPGEDVAWLFAIDRGDGSLRWSERVNGNIVGSSPAVVGDTVYFGAHNPADTPRPDDSIPGVYGYSTSGDRRWEYSPPERVTYAPEDVALPDEGFGSSPAVADGRIVIGGVDGTVYSFA
jgi:outer membrane protein assembly factor BamB